MSSLFSTGLKIRLTAILIYGVCAFTLVIFVNRDPKTETENINVSTSTLPQFSSSKNPLSIKLESTHNIQTWAISIDTEKLEAKHADMRQWISDTYIPQNESRLIIDTTPPPDASPFALKVSLKTPHTYHEKTYWSEGGDFVTSIDLAELHLLTQ